MAGKSPELKRKTNSERARERMHFVSSLNAQQNPCQCAANKVGGDMGSHIFLTIKSSDMKVKELILELKKYDENLSVGIGNLEDDSDQAIVRLESSAISKIERFDEFEDKLTGEYFLAK